MSPLAYWLLFAAALIGYGLLVARWYRRERARIAAYHSRLQSRIDRVEEDTGYRIALFGADIAERFERHGNTELGARVGLRAVER